MEGWILLHKQLLEWEWYKDTNCKCLFIHCLLKANYSDKEWKGKIIKRGQFFTSLDTLSNELNLSIKEIRGASQKLQKTKELGMQGASDGTMITVCNYERYQDLEILKGKQLGKQRASKGQAKGQQLNNNTKEDNENNEIYGSQKNIVLTKIEYDRLVAEFNGLTDKAIEFLSLYKVEKNYKTKSDNLTIRRWVLDAVREKEIKNKPVEKEIFRPELKPLFEK